MSAAKSKKKDPNSNAGGDISDRLEHVFLAGLGALSTASEIGAKTFESLVDQGEQYRKKASKTTEKLIREAQEAVRDVTENAQSRASGLFDQVRDTSNVSKLHDVFDRRVDSALSRIGVPTRKDFDALNAKLDKLIKLVETVPAGDEKPAPRKAAAKKTATRKKASKKKVSKKKASAKTSSKKAAPKKAAAKKSSTKKRKVARKAAGK